LLPRSSAHMENGEGVMRIASTVFGEICRNFTTTQGLLLQHDIWFRVTVSTPDCQAGELEFFHENFAVLRNTHVPIEYVDRWSHGYSLLEMTRRAYQPLDFHRHGNERAEPERISYAYFRSCSEPVKRAPKNVRWQRVTKNPSSFFATSQKFQCNNVTSGALPVVLDARQTAWLLARTLIATNLMLYEFLTPPRPSGDLMQIIGLPGYFTKLHANTPSFDIVVFQRPFNNQNPSLRTVSLR
ncbi:unnamed protein product, partial [Nesidiocoris tenuis]